MPEFQTTQLRVRKNCIIAEGSAGQVFYATASRARVLINAGAAELVNVGPAERQLVGPSETKPAEPAEKKYSAGVAAGPLTATAPSIESGKGILSSASAAGLVSTQRSAPPSKRRGRPPKSR